MTGLELAIVAGMASVYWEDREICCGQRFNPKSYQVAHPQGARAGAMPFGTCLAVARGRRQVTVMVMDNGPHIRGRVLDVTPAVNRALRLGGLGRVRFWRTQCPGP